MKTAPVELETPDGNRARIFADGPEIFITTGSGAIAQTWKLTEQQRDQLRELVFKARLSERDMEEVEVEV